MIVWLASFPGSGSQIVRQHLQAIYGVGTQHLDPRIGIGQRGLPIPFGSIDDADPSTSNVTKRCPLFVETHELSSDDLPAIYVVRDGRDALSSLARFIVEQEFHCSPLLSDHAYLNTLRRVIYYNDRFGGWSHHVASWTDRAARTAIIQYEQLVKAPAPVLSSALHHLGIELNSIQQSRRNSLHNISSTTTTDIDGGLLRHSEKNLPPQLESLFWKYHGRMMNGLGYQPFSRRAA